MPRGLLVAAPVLTLLVSCSSGPAATHSSSAPNSADSRYLAAAARVAAAHSLPRLPDAEALAIAHRICADAVRYDGRQLGAVDDATLDDEPGLGPKSGLVNVLVDLIGVAVPAYCPKYSGPMSTP